ncbi:MAG: LamG domain-containing protein, partial [Bryobacterales bacterium]|nr:LamG domain-containing protein [Bryobacterales bacterium]
RLWRVDIEPAQCAQPEVGIVHFLPFDGAPGDFIENAYVASRSELLFAPGLIGQALHLDSNRDVGFHSSSDIQFPAETSTLAFFIKPAKPVTNVPLFEKPLVPGEAGWSLSFNEQSHPVLELVPVAGPKQGFTAGVPLADKVWTHIAFVRAGDTFSAYVNGKPAGSLTIAGIDVKTWARPTAIGKSEVRSGRFEGLLDELAMWARAFSPREVKELYEKRLAAPCRP